MCSSKAPSGIIISQYSKPILALNHLAYPYPNPAPNTQPLHPNPAPLAGDGVARETLRENPPAPPRAAEAEPQPPISGGPLTVEGEEVRVNLVVVPVATPQPPQVQPPASTPVLTPPESTSLGARPEGLGPGEGLTPGESLGPATVVVPVPSPPAERGPSPPARIPR